MTDPCEGCKYSTEPLQAKTECVRFRMVEMLRFMDPDLSPAIELRLDVPVFFNRPEQEACHVSPM